MALKTNSNAYQQDNCDSILDDIISDFIQEDVKVEEVDEEFVVKVETNLEFEFEDVEEFSDPLAADSEPPKKKLCHEMVPKGIQENVQQIITKTYKLQCTECKQLFENNWTKITLHECSPQEEEETPPPNTTILQAYRCNKCKKHFISKSARSAHYKNCPANPVTVTKSNSNRLQQCSKCNKFFINDFVTTSHSAVCKGCENKKTYSKFECALCHCIKKDKKSLSNHLLGHNEELLFQQRSFTNSDNEQNLVMAQQLSAAAAKPAPVVPSLPPSIIVRNLPPSILPTPKPIPPEIIAKLKPSPFNCDKCGHGFGTSQAFRSHLKKCNPVQHKEVSWELNLNKKLLSRGKPGPKSKKVKEQVKIRRGRKRTAKKSPRRSSSPDIEIIEEFIVPGDEEGKVKRILPRLGPYKLV